MWPEDTVPSLTVSLFPFHLESLEDQSSVSFSMVPDSELMLVAGF